MAVSASAVKELRELTGAGMLDCKNALVETDGDIKKAIDYLREKGLAAAAKKAGRIAADGLVHTMISADGQRGVVVEVNCETDFVAKNDEFRAFVNSVASQALASKNQRLEDFLAEPWINDAGISVADAVSGQVARIGEKIDIRRFDVIEKGEGGVFATYIHGNGKIAVLLEMEAPAGCEKAAEAGKNLCMQIAALFPKYVSANDIDPEFMTKEREIIRALTMNEEAESGNKKPAAVVEKMIEGRLAKQLKEVCLMDQPYVKDNGVTCAQYLEAVSREAGAAVAARRFVCYEKGEGIEKREDNFGEEISKMIGN